MFLLFELIVIVIIIEVCGVIHERFFFSTVIVSLGYSDKDEDIQGGMKSKRRKCSDQGIAGELN